MNKPLYWNLKYLVLMDNIVFAIRFNRDKKICSVGGNNRFIADYILLIESIFKKVHYDEHKIQKNKTRFLFKITEKDFLQGLNDLRELNYIVDSKTTLDNIDR